MDVYYINLAQQADRRAALESNFAACTGSDWRLTRIEAVTAAEAARRDGTARDAEKACQLSHVRALTAALDHPDHAFIVEDDTLFGAGTARAVEAALKSIPPDAWDIVFTDIIVASASAMTDLFLMRRKLAGASRLLELGPFSFGGSMAYIVNGRSKRKVLDAITGATALNRAYDLELRRLVSEKTLRAFLLFPFATTQSQLGDSSTIQSDAGSAADAAWTAFRRLLWRERDIETAMQPLKDLDDSADTETRAFTKILGAILAPEFPRK